MSRTILCLAALLAVALGVAGYLQSEEEILMQNYAKVLDEAHYGGDEMHVTGPFSAKRVNIFQLLEGYKQLSQQIELSLAKQPISFTDSVRIARDLETSGRASLMMRIAIECFLFLDQLEEHNVRTCGSFGEYVAAINSYLANAITPLNSRLISIVNQKVRERAELCK